MQKSVYHQFASIEEFNWWFVARRKIIDSFLKRYVKGRPADLNALDVGAGTGTNISVIQKVAHNITCLEPSDEGCEYISRQSIPNCRVIKGNFPEAIPAHEKFDLITMFDVLEHIEDDRKVVQSLKNMLNKNGQVFITVPAYKWMWTDHDEVVHHKRRYTAQSLEDLFVSHGFIIEHITYFNSILFPPIALYRLISKFFAPRKKNTDFIPLPKFINSILTWIFVLEKPVLKYISLPFGVSVFAIMRLDKKVG